MIKHMFEKLKELLKRKNQRFICKHNYSPEPSPEEYVVYIEHVIDKKLSESELNQLKVSYGNFPEFIEFYKQYGGLHLYTQTDEDETAFHIAHPDEWSVLDYFFKSWFKDLSEQERKEIIPDWLSDYTVVAEVPKSSTYYLLVLDGAKKGQVYEFDHDGYEFYKRGNNFEEFVNGLCDVNKELINDLQYHVRYKDKVSTSQWIVEKYEYDT